MELAAGKILATSRGACAVTRVVQRVCDRSQPFTARSLAPKRRRALRQVSATGEPGRRFQPRAAVANSSAAARASSARGAKQGTMGKKDEEPPPIDAATRRTVANIQADWDNRELVEIVQLNLLTITKFLNDFDSATRYKLARVNEKLTRLERTLDSCEAAVRATLEGEGAASSSPPPRRPLPSSSPAKKKPPPPPSPPKKKPPPPPPKK